MEEFENFDNDNAVVQTIHPINITQVTVTCYRIFPEFAPVRSLEQHPVKHSDGRVAARQVNNNNT